MRRHRAPGRREMRPGGQVFVGLLIFVLGVVFLLDNLNIVEGREILRFWPVLLIAAGLNSLIGARDRGGSTVGLLLTGVGGLFLLDTLGIINVSPRIIWPIILIFIGLNVTIRAFSGPPAPLEGRHEGSSHFAFLGGVAHRAATPFRGGAATAFLGGVELDLSQATMEGDRAVLHVSVLMGGVELRIPDTWTLDLRITPILGGVENKTAAPRDAAHCLILQGTVLMGGVEIKN